MSHFMQDASMTAPVQPDEFGNRVKRAVFWRSGTQILAQLISWSVTLAVVRILDPSDYGLFAMTSVVLVFFNFLNGYGFVSALIQSESVEPIRVRQAFGMLLLVNGALALIQLLVAAPLAAAYYGEPIVAEMLRWQALIYLSTPFLILPEALMTRELEFKRPAIINLVTAAVGAAISLALALGGFGVWTLVFAPIAMFWCRALLLTFTTRFFVWPSFDFRGAGHIFGFGMALLAGQAFFIVQSQADIFIAGRHFETHNLGLYAQALFVTQLFAVKFVPPLNEVAFPAYARLQDNRSALTFSFLKAVRLIMLVACPLYLGMAISAGPFIETLLGPKWLAAAPIVATLALAMPFFTLQILFAPALNALGLPRLTLHNAIAGALIMPVTYLLAVQYGAQGLAAGWLVSVPLLLAFTIYQARPHIGFTLGQLGGAVLPGVGAALVMAAAVWGADHLVMTYIWREIPAMLHLAALTLAGGLVYAALLRFGAPATFDEVLALVLRRQATPVPASA
jgi:O-antigen/teichoic acid export membrane protein